MIEIGFGSPRSTDELEALDLADVDFVPPVVILENDREWTVLVEQGETDVELVERLAPVRLEPEDAVKALQQRTVDVRPPVDEDAPIPGKADRSGSRPSGTR